MVFSFIFVFAPLTSVNYMWRYISSFILIGLGMSTGQAQLVTFDTAADYTGNFVEMYDGVNGNVGPATMSYDSTNQRVSLTAAIFPFPNLGLARYAPGGLPGPGYLTETLEADAIITGGTGLPRVTLLARIQTSGFGVSAFLLRNHVDFSFGLVYDFDTAAFSSGTTFWSATLNPLTGVLTPDTGFSGGSSVVGTPTHLILTQTSGSDPVFNLTLTNSSGFVASTGNVALTATEAYNLAGGIGFSMGTQVAVVGLDNFQILSVPEPGSLELGILGLILLCGGIARSRRVPAPR
jgi:hypothetical protein